ncbi:histidine kinase [Paenibacillus selenitireducens]|uniref:histidine kinase n=2 Tax=Paenibacillus selenitireducens TaxID=1324314 RepID=A0A1T2XAV3_9BACL|nr:histidine kinase [Paenibacillus selenitireducens]
MSSIVLDKAPNLAALLISGCLFMLSIVFDKKWPRLQYTQILLLGLFHWYSHLNWCQLLYCILVISAIEKKPKYAHGAFIAIYYVLQYTAIRLSYQSLSTYNLLVSLFDLMTSIVIVLLFRYVMNLEMEKKRLSKKYNFLSTHDSVTGLLNYEGYMKSIQDFVQKEEPFILVLLDLQDFKSINHESMENGNEILAKIAQLLHVFFPNAKAISRYAGDRFALILPPQDNVLLQLGEMLDSNALGFQVTYCTTRFPSEAVTSQELITFAEEKLFQNRRKLWFKREENMFRSEKLKAVGELAAGMAHEIRNPLTTIKGFMQIAVHHDYNVRPWFDTIMSEITRMNELTAEFLQFSKPHISNMKPEPIGHLIDRLLFLIESEAAFRGHRIHYEPSNSCEHINMDRDKIVQVLLNLVRNAFEAMQESGDVYIRIQVNDFAANIEIEDTGSGIPEQHLVKIFNPFYTTKDNGTGLGLSICQKIAQDHGGTLDVTSEIDKGSIFRLRLPIIPHMPKLEDE